MHQIPNPRNRHEPDQHHTRIIHRHLIHRQRRRHTKQHQLKRDPRQRHHIHHRPDHPPAMKPRARHLPPSVRQTDRDGDGVAQRQRDDADGHERGEGRRAAQVDQAEQHLHDGQEKKGPDGHAEARRHARPQRRAGDGVVARDGPGAARGGVGDADGAEERDGEDEEDEAEAAACGEMFC